MIVMKFGGTSVESAAAIERVAGIVRGQESRRPVVVVSAMGKTTNKLLAIAAAAINGKREEYIRQLHDLRDYHSREARLVVPLAERASLDRTLDEHFQELTELVKGLAVLGELTPRSIDAISSYGERLSSYIVTLAFRHFGMRAEHVDSRDVIVTDKRHTHAAPIFSETYARLAAQVKPLAEKSVVVMGGFIASTEDGVTTTLGRGGSDFTASIVGAGIEAEEIQIWTDVDGMLTADPTILPGGHRVKTHLFRGSRRVGVLRRQSAASGHRGAGGGEEHSRADSEFAAAGSIGHAHCGGSRAVRERGEVDCLQAQNHAGEYSFHTDADGAWFSASHLRSVRPLRDPGGYGGDFRGQRIFDHRQSRAAGRDSAMRSGEFAEVDTEREQAIVCLVGDNIRYTPGVARARVHGARRHQHSHDFAGRVVVESELRGGGSRPVRHGGRRCTTEFFTELDPEVFERNEAVHA